MTLIERLRGILYDVELTQDQYDALCEAILELGGNPLTDPVHHTNPDDTEGGACD